MSPIGTPGISPTVCYRDASAAIEWLRRAFGFEQKAMHRDDQRIVHHAELRLASRDQDYGGRDYGAADLEGNRWSFGGYDLYASE